MLSSICKILQQGRSAEVKASHVLGGNEGCTTDDPFGIVCSKLDLFENYNVYVEIILSTVLEKRSVYNMIIVYRKSMGKSKVNMSNLKIKARSLYRIADYD